MKERLRFFKKLYPEFIVYILRKGKLITNDFDKNVLHFLKNIKNLR